ncbi:hypothetical protein DSO57_1002950 [Entomophthora muscae]|uniref:Uncharacterized protein n=1 Tax=Entomophthora muscae TaxID=34485 RepID=A0ACC2T8S1_9FUNG|nr:hypothetical protein DSO57_1002950 [Entomophthora muscae]
MFIHCFGNRPFGEILCGNNQIFLPTNTFCYRSHVVDAPHFKESTDCNWVDWFGYQVLLGEHLTRIMFLKVTLLNLRHFDKVSMHTTTKYFPYNHIVATISENSDFSIRFSCCTSPVLLGVTVHQINKILLSWDVLDIHKIFGHLHHPVYPSTVLLLFAQDEEQHHVVCI